MAKVFYRFSSREELGVPVSLLQEAFPEYWRKIEQDSLRSHFCPYPKSAFLWLMRKLQRTRETRRSLPPPQNPIEAIKISASYLLNSNHVIDLCLDIWFSDNKQRKLLYDLCTSSRISLERSAVLRALATRRTPSWWSISLTDIHGQRLHYEQDNSARGWLLEGQEAPGEKTRYLDRDFQLRYRKESGETVVFFDQETMTEWPIVQNNEEVVVLDEDSQKLFETLCTHPFWNIHLQVQLQTGERLIGVEKNQIVIYDIQRDTQTVRRTSEAIQKKMTSSPNLGEIYDWFVTSWPGHLWGYRKSGVCRGGGHTEFPLSNGEYVANTLWYGHGFLRMDGNKAQGHIEGVYYEMDDCLGALYYDNGDQILKGVYEGPDEIGMKWTIYDMILDECKRTLRREKMVNVIRFSPSLNGIRTIRSRKSNGNWWIRYQHLIPCRCTKYCYGYHEVPMGDLSSPMALLLDSPPRREEDRREVVITPPHSEFICTWNRLVIGTNEDTTFTGMLPHPTTIKCPATCPLSRNMFIPVETGARGAELND